MGLNFALYEGFKQLANDAIAANTRAGVHESGTGVHKDSLWKTTVLRGLCGGAAGGLSKLIVYPLVSSNYRHTCGVSASNQR
jgi:hypothetical protein